MFKNKVSPIPIVSGYGGCGEVQSHLKIFKHSLVKISLHKLFAVSQLTPWDRYWPTTESHSKELQLLQFFNVPSLLHLNTWECHVNLNGLFVLQNSFLRSFFLTNLVKTETGFRWRINLEALENNLPEVSSFPTDFPHQHFDGKALFIGGARSDYVR